MAGRTNSSAPLRFRGSPHGVEGLAPVAYQEIIAGGCSLDLKLPAGGQAVTPPAVQTMPAGSAATLLRFSLPESTPPGTYEGTVRIGAARYSIVIDVDAHAYLVLTPSWLSLDIVPGAEVVVDLTIVNTGNIAWELPRAHSFGLFDDHGLERGIGSALRGDGDAVQDRINRLSTELVESHGGLVRVAIQEGAGLLAPGELKNLRVALRFADRLKPGRSYSGTWPLLNLRYHVQVHVTSKEAIGKERP